MASHLRPPKPWQLGEEETVSSFEAWKGNVVFNLSLVDIFTPYLSDDCKWLVKSASNTSRGFTDDDGATADPPVGLTAAKKATNLEIMLGQIANYCTVISRASIVKKSTSLEDVWQKIRLHYGIQRTGGHFLDLDNISHKPGDRVEPLYQTLMGFIEDNLLAKGGGITHHDQAIKTDEELTPTMENMIVLMWLRLIHPGLPRLVKQKYGTTLRTKTLASIKDEISLAMDSLLDELHYSDEVKVMRTNTKPQIKEYKHYSSQSGPARSHKQIPNQIPKTKSCPLCTEAKRPKNHYLSSCPYLPDSDRRFLSKVRQMTEISSSLWDTCENHNYELSDNEENETPLNTNMISVNKVNSKRSPSFKAFYKDHSVNLTLDTGAESSMIRASVARMMGLNIQNSSQVALQADGRTPLPIIGEVHTNLQRNGHNLHLEALVVEDLDAEILAGTPFMISNDISLRPSKCQITISNVEVLTYKPFEPSLAQSAIRRTFVEVLRAPKTDTIWPGEFMELDISHILSNDSIIAIEPRSDSRSSVSSPSDWPPPSILESVAGKVRILNQSNEPQHIKRNEHVCSARPVSTLPYKEPIAISSTSEYPTKPIIPSGPYSNTVKIDPNEQLTPTQRAAFKDILDKYDDVFKPDLPGYNGACGPFKAVVNMGPVKPPQRKGRVPQYNRDNLVELQDIFDKLEGSVFFKPEDIGVNVEYLNPTFLVNKPLPSGGKRLVTAFADVGRYCKPQPSLMPDVDSILRTIGGWKYIIQTDLTKAFFQIPLDKESMKYCGVATPFKGIRVYGRCAMGLPGSETALEELMCRILGDCIQKGTVAKLADDLFCGGNTPEDLLHNWAEVIENLHKCNMRLAPHKTVICPKSTTILGWIWSMGSIQASPHKISTLTAAQPPESVRGMRSFIGAYKVLGRVLKDCATWITPLDEAISGMQSNEKVKWDDNLKKKFREAQNALMNNKSIVLPIPTDQLWIVTDGSVKNHGVGATLYVTRNNKPRLAGFFSSKLRKHQVNWLPCEVEALGIAAAVKHFSPYIIQSKHKTCVLTDSKPCVQAIEKLYRGEFSASPRITSFLTIVSRYQVSLQHLTGKANIPSDFASRNAPDCLDPMCQICSFINKMEQCTVMKTSVQDIINNISRVPFSSRSGWLSTQSECNDLRRVHAHLKQGTRPSKKLTNIKDVKRYLGVASIAGDGMLVVKKNEPLFPSRELIIIPRSVLHGFLTALHIKLDHPTKHQLKLVTARQFYALDIDKAISTVTDSCHTCVSLKSMPEPLTSMSTCEPPPVPGILFSVDVMKQNRQLIFVLRESVTSFTTSCIIDNERQESLSQALICLSANMIPLDRPKAVVRVDGASGLRALKHSALLPAHNIIIEVGEVKNKNKNPVGEKAVQELEIELLKQNPSGGAISNTTLAIATARLNERIRFGGLSAREKWCKRDQFTNVQIPIDDQQLIITQHEQRLANHPYSLKAKNPKGFQASPQSLCVGDLVYLKSDKSKVRARDRYIIVQIQDSEWCFVKKFSGIQLRAQSYKVRLQDCFSIQPTASLYSNSNSPLLQDVSEDEEVSPSIPNEQPANNLPMAPLELTAPYGVTPGGHIDFTSPESHLSDSVISENRQVDSGCTRNPEPLERSPIAADTEHNQVGQRRSGRLRREPERYDDFLMRW